MTNPPILTVEPSALNGIWKYAKPRGLFMAESAAAPMQWAGIDTRVRSKKARLFGTFPEVLAWLMQRAGILDENGKPVRARVTVAEKLPERDFETPIRVEGAVIRPWEPEVVIEEVAVRDEEDVGELPHHGGWGENTIKVGTPSEKKRAGRPFGSVSGENAMVRRRDAQILRLTKQGMGTAEIAEALGYSLKTIQRRKQILRERGELEGGKYIKRKVET